MCISDISFFVGLKPWMEIYTEVNINTELCQWAKINVDAWNTAFEHCPWEWQYLVHPLRNELQAYSKLLLLMNIVSFDSTEQQLCEQPFLGRKEINYGEKSCLFIQAKKYNVSVSNYRISFIFFPQALSNAKKL